MADIKWIKLYTNMLNNKKIKRIRKMPEGNNVILIWVFLIAEAGKCNKDGGLYLTNVIPFSVDDLAIEFDFEKDTMNLALSILEKFEMIELYDDVIFIKNWDEYQNIDGLEKIREQTRLRVAKTRAKKKNLVLLEECNATCNVTVTQCNAIELELEEDKEIKKGVGFHPPSLIEVSEYCASRKNNIDAEQFIDFYKSKGWMVGKTKMKDWKASVRTWEKRNKDTNDEKGELNLW